MSASCYVNMDLNDDNDHDKYNTRTCKLIVMVMRVIAKGIVMNMIGMTVLKVALLMAWVMN